MITEAESYRKACKRAATAMTESEVEAYRKAYNRAATANPMTADCPPADEADSIRDEMVEKIAEDKLQEAISDPDIMAELILENDYNQEGFKDMVIALSAMIDVMINGPKKLKDIQAYDARLLFAESMRDFIEKKAVSLAEAEVDD